MERKLILASNSPRRQELLRGLGLDFEIDTRNSFVEVVEPGTPARDVPMLMSVGKSHGFHRPLEPGEVLITSDTSVIAAVDDAGCGDGHLVALGKPRDREDAIAMLHLLSGRTHEVMTAVTLRSAVSERSFTDSTSVTFLPLEESEIVRYVDGFRPYDKAGAYAIQEWIGFIGISAINGSYFNVMGFPVHRVWQELKSFR